jgi:GT2 family glycosyltransferase
MSPEISIIVPHLNQPEHLAALIGSLYAQRFDMARAEVIVVDNGSRALPREVIAHHPGACLVEEPQSGPGPARNKGVSLAQAPILAFVDADCTVHPDWATAILARFAADPGLEIIGGDVRIPVEPGSKPSLAEAYEMVYAFQQKRYIERMNFSGTGNLAMRRAAFEAVGPFSGIKIAEDTDWGHRATRLGRHIVYVPEMIVYHPARQTLAEIYTKWDRQVSHHYAAFARSPADKLRWAAKTLAMGISPLAEIPRILGTNRLKGARTRWRAFLGLAAIRLYRMRKMAAVMVVPASRHASTQWNRK